MKTPKGGDFFPVERAVAGVQGIARTVFRGDRIEEFPLEIIGRYRNFTGPGQDVILARLLGERTSFTGVVAGMSGSPVYIEGRLLGALSYRMGVFSKEPIAGITPIGEMIRAGEFPVPSLGSRAGGAGEPADGGGLVPIETPLLLAGFERHTVEAFLPRLRALGLRPVQAGSASGASSDGGQPLVPGAPIAAVLVRGDRSIAAAGTLTYIDGKKLYAFGHPFLQTGSTELPAARATILWTLSSWFDSNKIAEIGETIGTFQEDRLTGIVGELGPSPRMIPVTVEVVSHGIAPHLHRFEIAREKNLVPLLVNITVSDSLASSLEVSAEATVFLSGEIAVAGHAPIRFDDAFTSAASLPVAFSAASRIAGIVQKIYDNPFQEPGIEAVTVRLSQVPRVLASTVEWVGIPAEELRPGAPFEIAVHLRNYRNESTVEFVSASIPPGTLPGAAVLMVGEAGEVEAALPQRAALQRLGASPDYTAYLDRLSEEPRGGRLVLRITRPARGASVRSEILPDLPPSVLSLFAARRGGDRPSALPGLVLWERIIELPGPASGLKTFPLRIGRVGLPTARKDGQ